MPTLGRAAQSTGSLWPGSLRRGPTALPREEPSQPLAVQPPELKHQTRKRCVPALDMLPAECSHLNEPGNTPLGPATHVVIRSNRLPLPEATDLWGGCTHR